MSVFSFTKHACETKKISWQKRVFPLLLWRESYKTTASKDVNEIIIIAQHFGSKMAKRYSWIMFVSFVHLNGMPTTNWTFPWTGRQIPNITKADRQTRYSYCYIDGDLSYQTMRASITEDVSTKVYRAVARKKLWLRQCPWF